MLPKGICSDLHFTARVFVAPYSMLVPVHGVVFSVEKML